MKHLHYIISENEKKIRLYYFFVFVCIFFSSLEFSAAPTLKTTTL